jgi:membrane protein
MPNDAHPSTIAQLKDDFTRLPLKDLGKRAYKKIGADQVTTMAGAFAYSWTFSIPPLILLTVLFAALLNEVTNVPVVENMQDAIKKHAPADTQEMLLRMVDSAVAKVGGNAASFGVILTGILALWAASNAIGALITGFNRAYDVEEDRPFLKKKGVQLGLTLMLVLFVNAVVALLVFGQQIGNWLADWIGVGSAFNTFWSFARWPLGILGIMLALAVLYWAGPNVDLPFRWVSAGTIVATVLWLLLVGGFGLYMSFSDPGSAYGAVGAVIVLLVFLNLTGIVFFLGAEINAILYSAVARHQTARWHSPSMAVANQ